MDSQTYDVLIIGSGMGGLGAGLKLQSSNPKLRTITLEQHDIPGGYVNGFKRKGYYFDSGAEGAVFCGEGQTFKLVLDELGVKQEFIKVDPVEHMCFPDKEIVMYGNAEKYQTELSKNFPENKDEIKSFFRVIKSIKDEIRRVVKGKFKPSFGELIKIILTCPTLRKYATKSFNDLLNEYITNVHLRDVLAVYSLWLGVQPKKIKALTAAIVFFSPYYEGLYYPKGGMLAWTKNMAKTYTDQGGEIRYKTKVRKILIEKGKAVGVELENGTKLKGKWVVSNADLYKTVFELVGKDYFPSKYSEFVSNLEQSITGFLVFLGLDTHLKDTPSHIAYNVRAESYLEKINSGKYDPEEVLIRIPDKIDPSLQNDKGSAVILLTLAPYAFKNNWGAGKDGERTTKYKEIKEQYAQQLIQLAENVIPNLSKHIVYQDVATPLTFERYTLNTRGAWYGAKKGQRKPKQQTPLKNLLLAGGNVSGAGVPACFFSGVKAGEMILKRLKKNR
ncbi:MAG: phytoene desaturase family protein [Candidatus Heimdallarchaeaceae archaeon]